MMPFLPINLVGKVCSIPQGGGRAGRRGLYITAAVILMPLVALIAWTIIGIDKTKAELFHEMGYLEIVPPSTLHAPGSFNTVEYLDDSSVQLHPTCQLDSEALSGLTMVSKTVDRDIREYLSSRFRLELLNNLKTGLSGEYVQSVQLSLRNMRILLLTHEALFDLHEKYLNGPCERAIIHNIQNGGEVCQAEAIIQADMVYTVLYNSDTDSAQQKKVAEDIAASVDLNAKHQGKNEFKGYGLYYAVKLSKKCLVLPEEEQQLAGVG